MKTTLRELISFTQNASRYVHVHSETSKLTYALSRMLKRCTKFTEEFEEALEDVRIENCLVDKDSKAVLRDERNQYKFDREGVQKVSKKQRELLNGEVEIEPYFATDIPPDLSDNFRIAFEGFVLKPESDESV